MAREDNVAFMFDNQVDRAAVAASSEAGSLPAVNLKNSDRSVVFRTGAVTTVTVDVTLAAGELAPVNMAAIVDHNVGYSGSIRLQSWSDAIGGASPGVDVTVLPYEELLAVTDAAHGDIDRALLNLPRVVTLVPIAAANTHRYWRWTLTDATKSYLQAARLCLGASYQPKVNIDWGWAKSLGRRTRGNETLGGQRYGNALPKRKTMDVTLSWMDYADAAGLDLQLQTLGDLTPVIATIYTDDDGKEHALSALYCTVEDEAQSEKRWLTHGQRIKLIEVL